MPNNVRLVGFLPGKISSALAVMKLSVIPSLTEGLPLTLVEAVSIGKPIVNTKVGGLGDANFHSKVSFFGNFVVSLCAKAQGC